MEKMNNQKQQDNINSMTEHDVLNTLLNEIMEIQDDIICLEIENEDMERMQKDLEIDPDDYEDEYRSWLNRNNAPITVAGEEYTYAQVLISLNFKTFVAGLREYVSAEYTPKDTQEWHELDNRIHANNKFILSKRTELNELIEKINFRIEDIILDGEDGALNQYLSISIKECSQIDLAEIKISSAYLKGTDNSIEFPINKKDALAIINYLSVIFEIRPGQKRKI